MATLLGFNFAVPEGFEFLTITWVSIILNAIAWILFAILVNLILLRVIRFITRQLPGDLEDIVFGILRGPLILLILLYGCVQTLNLLSLTAPVRHYVQLVTITIVVLTITHILGRVIKDILVYYGNKWARKTESRIDDVLIPIFNLFGPVFLVLAAALIILPMWGFNVTSVLVGAGVIGLVLGLALQSTLANIFSGLSLLVEAPFKAGDLITLSDGRKCEVQRVGMRSTQLYSVTEHATIYVPNTMISSEVLTIITKPTVDQKLTLDLKIPGELSIRTLAEDVRKIALSHPATLSSNIPEKVEQLKQRISRHDGDPANLPEGNLELTIYDEKWFEVIPRLELEGELNSALKTTLESLRNLVRGIRAREAKGLSETELQEIFCNYISPVEPSIERVLTLAKSWSQSIDPWLDKSEHWDNVRLWEFRNSQLMEHWEKLKKAIYHPNDRTEMRLDDLAMEMLDWIQQEYKILPEYWKDPVVLMKGFDGPDVLLQVSYYVDNIRLEHDERANRVQSEIAFQVQNLIKSNYIHPA